MSRLGERGWGDPGKELSRGDVPGNSDASLGRHYGKRRGDGVPGGEMREQMLLG